MTTRTRKSAPQFSRSAALSARPRRLPFIARKETPNGGLRVTVMLLRTGWAKWLGASGEFERTFGLDPVGREVYEACDGKRSAEAIIRAFAGRRKVSLAEAEISVTTFLKTMMSKGLIAMVVEDGRSGQ